MRGVDVRGSRPGTPVVGNGVARMVDGGAEARRSAAHRLQSSCRVNVARSRPGAAVVDGGVARGVDPDAEARGGAADGVEVIGRVGVGMAPGAGAGAVGAGDGMTAGVDGCTERCRRTTDGIDGARSIGA